jgi:hypothetical protein
LITKKLVIDQKLVVDSPKCWSLFTKKLAIDSPKIWLLIRQNVGQRFAKGRIILPKNWSEIRQNFGC